MRELAISPWPGIWAVGLWILKLFLKLNIGSTLVLALWFGLMAGFHRKRLDLQNVQKKRFEDASIYMDTLLYSFVREGKVIRAFEDVKETLPEGQLKEEVSHALDHMELAFEEDEVLSYGMRCIEAAYPCRRIQNIHNFLLHVEYYGGSLEKPVELLLTDKSRWEARIRAHRKEREAMFGQIIGSAAASILVCGVILYMPVMNMDISQKLVTQVLAVVVLVLDDLIIYAGQKYLTEDWLMVDAMEEDAYYEKKMQEYQTFDLAKEKKLSRILMLLPLMGAAVFLFQGMQVAAAGCMCLALFCGNQHHIGAGLMRRRLLANIQSAFPNWLLDLVLLLQSENVQVAIAKSLEHAPGVLAEELRLLTARLELSPEDAGPYHAFLKEFDLPQVHSAMSMLYSLSIGNSSNGERQIAELIARNMELLDLSDTKRLQDKSSGMYLLFLAPVLTASLKLLVDMAVFLFAFLAQTGV